uniref:Uncharacterized protein n=1 Tax=Solanum lycopersicum TaxID=4081 RepID=A0A3Q7H8B7_SOLLC
MAFGGNYRPPDTQPRKKNFCTEAKSSKCWKV